MLINLTLADIAKACEGELIGVDAVISAVVTDTRQLIHDCVFVALKGENFDGHDYADFAMANGAISVVSEKNLDVKSYIKVSDTRRAYGSIAHLIRKAFKGPVICITGSNGKTTVKDWLAQSLHPKNVLKTHANLNNQIGVPQTILGLESDHDIAVIETGASVLGEIKNLANITRPDVVILNNASGSHFEGFGSIEGIAIEKGCLITGSAPDAKVVLNSDDPFFDYWWGLSLKRQVMSFGFTSSADLYAKDIILEAESSCANFVYRGESYPVFIAGAGKHQIANGMAVVLAMVAVGVSFSESIKKLAHPVVVAGRLERLRAKNGALLINDCYNASPTSVEAAINVLVMQSVNKTWLVLGALGELGNLQDDVHNELGVYAHKKGVSCLICIGPVAGIAGMAFENCGGDSIFCNTYDEVVSVVQSLDEKHAILVKGSRSARMENVIDVLKK